MIEPRFEVGDEVMFTWLEPSQRVAITRVKWDGFFKWWYYEISLLNIDGTSHRTSARHLRPIPALTQLAEEAE